MADFSFIVDVTEVNLNDILQRSLETPLVLTFYAPSHPESANFSALLQQIAERYQGQFILAKVNCEQEQMIAAQFRIQALPTTYLFKQAQALDAFPGALDETTLLQRLSVILPKEEDSQISESLGFFAIRRLRLSLTTIKRSLGTFR